MDVSVADAKNHLSELLRSVAEGERVVITRNGKAVARNGKAVARNGKAVAQLVPLPPEHRVVRFGTMRGRIHLKPGWDDPIDVDRFLTGDL